MNPDKPKAKRIARWINLVTWSAIGFFAVGYFPAYISEPAWAIRISMTAAAMAVIPYAVRIGRPLKSALIAALLGAVTGVGIINAFLSLGMIPPQGMGNFAAKYVAATAFFCASVGALFGYMALQRHRQVEQEWEDRQ